ncbi:hypothetical protein ILUMI_27067 [Ignelater luminosus]|uniref:CHK kinase-like domain-containing protein n=1 Tax=Ignelater luminosus TaxID=2038154 RepID=A0A8K0FYB6_IGNLU|nr:hypothetical protein ILUMI_27067 [Ignelater luminosus]
MVTMTPDGAPSFSSLTIRLRLKIIIAPRQTVFGLFKKFVASDIDSLLLQNLNQTMGVFALPRIYSLAWDRAASFQDIQSSIRLSGISSFYPDIFNNIDFMFCFVSDRETLPVASTNATKSIYTGVTTVSTTIHSAQATRVSPQKGNFPVAETSASAIPAQLRMKNTMTGLATTETSNHSILYPVTLNDEANLKTRISAFDYKDLLYKTLKHWKFYAKDFKLFPLQNKSEGNLTRHFRVIIEFENRLVSHSQHEHQYYVKFLDSNLLDRRKKSVSKDYYDKEAFFYNYVLEECKKLNLDISFAPKFYYCTPYVLYFEDIALKNFENIREGPFFNLRHCKLALSALAKFHANSILLERELKKKGKQSLQNKHPHMFRENLPSQQAKGVGRLWFKYNLKTILDVVKVFPKGELQNGEEFMHRLIRFTDYWSMKFQELYDKHHNTVLHGDLGCNNFLFKYDCGVPVECVLVDYQLLKYGPPALDVLNTIYSNTRRNFRSTYLQHLTDYYYECLCDCLLAHQMDDIIMLKDEYLELCQDFRIFVKFQTICDRCILFIPESYVRLNVMRDDDFRRFLFERKLEAFVRCYKENAFFRTIMKEDMEDLFEIDQEAKFSILSPLLDVLTDDGENLRNDNFPNDVLGHIEIEYPSDEKHNQPLSVIGELFNRKQAETQEKVEYCKGRKRYNTIASTSTSSEELTYVHFEEPDRDHSLYDKRFKRAEPKTNV